MNILLIGGGRDSLPVIDALRKANCRIGLIDIDDNCYAKRMCDSFFKVSTFDLKGQLAVLDAINFDYCLSRSSGIAAKNCYQLNQYILGSELTNTANSLLNKLELMKVCKATGIKYPSTVSVDSIEDLLDLDFPMILKPVYEKIGKVTTSKISSTKGFQEKLAQTNENSQIQTSILQEYLPGQDFSLIGFCNNNSYLSYGLFLEQNILTDAGLTHSGFERELHKNIDPFLSIAELIARKIELPMCPMNLGFREGEGGLYLLECNLDFGGESVIENSLKLDDEDLIGDFVTQMTDGISKGWIE